MGEPNTTQSDKHDDANGGLESEMQDGKLQ